MPSALDGVQGLDIEAVGLSLKYIAKYLNMARV
jgi:hypothetical protein